MTIVGILQLALELFVDLGNLLLVKLPSPESVFCCLRKPLTPCAGTVSACSAASSKMKLTGPSDHETFFVTCGRGLGDEVEMNVVDDLLSSAGCRLL
jgi:hypothetical protein